MDNKIQITYLSEGKPLVNCRQSFIPRIGENVRFYTREMSGFYEVVGVIYALDVTPETVVVNLQIQK